MLRQNHPGVEKEIPGQASPATGAEAAGTAATGPTSIFGSVAMVPVAAVGLQKVVSEIREIVDGGDSPILSPVQPTIPVETIPESESQPEGYRLVEPVVIPFWRRWRVSVIAAAPEPSLAFQGRVVDGYVVGATVFYDENNNGILDDSESNYVGVTDADGNFQLPDFSAAAQGAL